MVRLSIDPPSSFRTSMTPKSSGGGGWGRFVFFLLVIAGVGGGGYYFGRRNVGSVDGEASRGRSRLPFFGASAPSGQVPTALGAPQAPAVAPAAAAAVP